MSDQQEVKTTTLGSIGTSFLVLFLLVVVAVIIYFVLNQSLFNVYPVSPFKYNQTVVIRPAILTSIDNINPNQYLEDSTIFNYQQGGCAPRFTYGDNAHALTFTGKKSDTRAQWILRQHSALCNLDANQSLLNGLGNRFFLENKARASITPDVSSNRVRYQRLNQNSSGYCYNTTTAVIGSNGTEECNWFNTELLVYFLPTNYSNLYYILFPSCSKSFIGQCDSLDTTTQLNDGIVSIRPWAPNNTSNNKLGERCIQCDRDELGTFNPFVNQNPTQDLNQNVMIMNNLFTIKPNGDIMPPYPDANIFLFEVTVV